MEFPPISVQVSITHPLPPKFEINDDCFLPKSEIDDEMSPPKTIYDEISPQELEIYSTSVATDEISPQELEIYLTSVATAVHKRNLKREQVLRETQRMRDALKNEIVPDGDYSVPPIDEIYPKSLDTPAYRRKMHRERVRRQTQRMREALKNEIGADADSGSFSRETEGDSVRANEIEAKERKPDIFYEMICLLLPTYKNLVRSFLFGSYMSP